MHLRQGSESRRMRSALKLGLERSLLWSGAAWLQRRRMAGRALILAYHNVVPDDEPPSGDRPNHLTLGAFRAQLDELQKTHTVVPLDETLLAPAASSRPRVSITFDDAYRGAIIHAIPELIRRGLPATIFVAPGCLGGPPFWWDHVASPTGLDADMRRRALEELRGDTATVSAVLGSGRASNGVPHVARAATEKELANVANAPGIAVASHTWSHPNLVRLTDAELKAELTRSLAWLEERFRSTVRWIAYPYGFHDARVERYAAISGYVAGLAVSGGWLTGEVANRFALPRVNIPRGLSTPGFRLRAAGILAN
jgi:peptidoglycan/xylan/chitin deacetylase (PgdA/CDA1 family)